MGRGKTTIVIRILSVALQRRAPDAFYDAGPEAVAEDDALALAAMQAEAATDDNPIMLRLFASKLDLVADEAIRHLVHNPPTPDEPRHTPASCLAAVRRIAFCLRCIREVYEPWFLRILRDMDYFIGPLRALEGTDDPEQYMACKHRLTSMLSNPSCIDPQRLCDMGDQLRVLRSKMDPITSSPDARLYVDDMLESVRCALTYAQNHMRDSPHLAMIRFRDQSGLLIEDGSSSNLPRTQFTYTSIRRLAAQLVQLRDPSQFPLPWAPAEQRRDHDGEFGTLEERIRAMLAEIDGLIADPDLEADDPRRFRWMAAQVLLAFLLLRVEDALRQREAERRLALAQAFARPRPGQAHAGIAGLGEDLVSSIAALSVKADHDPPGWS